MSGGTLVSSLNPTFFRDDERRVGLDWTAMVLKGLWYHGSKLANLIS